MGQGPGPYGWFFIIVLLVVFFAMVLRLEWDRKHGEPVVDIKKPVRSPFPGTKLGPSKSNQGEQV